jgi:CMP/dCMP kinase
VSMTERAPVLTIDGPSGSGKGTIATLVARELGWHLLDSGALYRLVALGAGRHNIDLADADSLAEYAASLDVCFELPPGTAEVVTRLEGLPVGDAIRSETCGNAASKVAALGAVRQALLQRQRDFRRTPGLVADGRDMGTVVFPDAELKIFLTASVAERAQRRYKQLIQKGISANLPDLLTEIAERDARDTQRTVSPLKPADDAVVLDTSELSIEETRNRVINLYRDRFAPSRQ